MTSVDKMQKRNATTSHTGQSNQDWPASKTSKTGKQPATSYFRSPIERPRNRNEKQDEASQEDDLEWNQKSTPRNDRTGSVTQTSNETQYLSAAQYYSASGSRSSEAEAGVAEFQISSYNTADGSVIYTVTDNATGVRAELQFPKNGTGGGDPRPTDKPDRVRSITIKQNGVWTAISKLYPPPEVIREGDVIETLLPSHEPNRQRQLVPRTRTPTAVSNHRPVPSRFVVLRANSNCTEFIALPIKTYLSLGVAAQGVIRSYHVMIYTGPEPPPLTPNEGPVRLHGTIDSLRDNPLRVIQRDRMRRLDPMSRLNLRDSMTLRVEDIVNVFGKVHPDSLPILIYLYQDVQRQAVADAIILAEMGRIDTQLFSMQASARSAGVVIPTPTREHVRVFAINHTAYVAYAQRVMEQINAALRNRS